MTGRRREADLQPLPAQDRRTKAEAEAIDFHIAPPGNEVVTGFVNNDQKANGQDRAEDGKHERPV